MSWLPSDEPHEAYTRTRRLTAMEFQLEEIDDLVDILYRGA